MFLNSYEFASEEHIAKERNKVREAKKSRWWQQKTSLGKCHYCLQPFKFKDLTMDHIVPLARGGTTSPGNVVPACKACNQKKSVETPVDEIFSQS
jgi:5-methylcytosine-specific restriction enzyme A